MLLINSKDWRPNSCLMEGGGEFYMHSFLKQMNQKQCFFFFFFNNSHEFSPSIFIVMVTSFFIDYVSVTLSP